MPASVVADGRLSNSFNDVQSTDRASQAVAAHAERAMR